MVPTPPCAYLTSLTPELVGMLLRVLVVSREYFLEHRGWSLRQVTWGEAYGMIT